MTTVGPDVDLDDDRLPAPGTDEGWAALAAEAARHGHPDPQAYVAAYQAGQINVGFAGYQPGDPHTGFGQVQAFDQAAAVAGVPLGQYTEMHTPEALAAARGVAEEIRGEGQHPPDGSAPGGESPFSPPANFTADGHVVEYGPDGTSMVTNDFRTLPEGVDHYDRYTGEPLDAQGHVVPGVPNAGDGHEFTTALDQRIGLDEHGRIDPAEIDRLEAEAREHGDATVGDLVAATTRPFPGHPLSDTGEYARPVVLPGHPPIAYSGPDGAYVIAGDGTVITKGPGESIVYEGEHGSAVIDRDGRVITTDEDGRITVTEASVDPGPILVPVDDFPGDVPGSDTDGIVTNEYHDLDDEDPTAVGEVPPAVAQPDPEPSFGQGDTTTDEVPDPRVTTTAEDLGPSSSSDEEPDEESDDSSEPAAEIDETTVGSDDVGSEEDGSPEFDTDLEPA